MTAKHIVFAGITALLTSALPAQDLTVIKAGALYQDRRSPILKDVVILIENGKIKKIAKGIEIPWNAEVIDASKSYVMPAWVLAHGSGGLDRANENMPVTPYLTVMDAVDPSSSYFESSRRHGIGMLHILPGNSTQIGGRGVLLKPFGRTPEDMALVQKAGMKMSLQATRGSRSQHLLQIEKAFKGALDHRTELQRQKAEWEEDKKNGATTVEEFDVDKKIDKLKKPLLDMLDGKIPVYLYVPGANDASTALSLVEKYKLKAVLVLGPTCYKAVNLFKGYARKNPGKLRLILAPTQEVIDKDPVSQEETLICPAKVFYDAGLPFALSSVSGSSRWGRSSGNPALAMPWYQVGICVRHGVPEDIAIAAFTEIPAMFLNRSKRFGRLQEGMDATMQILAAPPMEPESKVRMLLVEGQIVYDRSKDPRVKQLTGKPKTR
jgi:imidazolonepropionase-like amidohydrolase